MQNIIINIPLQFTISLVILHAFIESFLNWLSHFTYID